MRIDLTLPRLRTRPAYGCARSPAQDAYDGERVIKGTILAILLSLPAWLGIAVLVLWVRG